MMSDEGATLAALLRRSRISQAKLAREAGVSQATVSRALSGKGVRAGTAKAKLFTYIQDIPSIPQRAIDAVNQVWDGTEHHEDALATLIRASEELWPKLRKE